MSNLSIIIPARNEEFLQRTIENILENIEGDTEVIAVCDGYWPDPPIKDHPKVTLIHNSEARGQRSAQNQAARISQAKYLMKVDAHCAFDKGFDVKMMKAFEEDENVTMVPVMRNLHAFDWVCPEGHRRYQGPSGVCTECGKETVKDIVWIGKNNPQSTSYCFDTTLHFQYFNEYKKKQVGDLVETMSLQGSCFMLTRENYWKWNVCDETWNSWGQQGVEVALKTWFNGGRVLCNKLTWYAHMFRTKGDFSFPYHNPESKIEESRKKSRDLFFNWPGERNLDWLIKKFNPPYWNLKKGILYYSDNQLNMKLARKVREQIKKAGLPITSVTLKPTNFGHNIVLNEKRGKLTMHKQILAGLKAMTEDVVFFCEHDVIYHPSHFDFVPPKREIYYYNNNLWRVRMKDGFAVKYDHKSLSQLCAYRKTLIKEYEERVRKIEADGWDKNGYEPGTRSIRLGGFSDSKSEHFNSKESNIDIRHNNNLSASKWKPEQFKSQRSCRNWQESSIDNLWAKEICQELTSQNSLPK